MKKLIDKFLRKFGYAPIYKMEFLGLEHLDRKIFELKLVQSERIIPTIKVNDPNYEEHMKHFLAEQIVDTLIPFMDYSCEYYPERFSADHTEKIMKYKLYVGIKQKE